MRKLASITPRTNPPAPGAHAFARRSVRSDVFNSLTCLALFLHDQNDTQIFVSHNDDPLNAVWIKKQPLLIDPRFAGRFVVITLTKVLAQQKQLAVFPILDFARYTPDERKQLQAAIDAAYRARSRHCFSAGRMQSSMGHGGRNNFQ